MLAVLTTVLALTMGTPPCQCLCDPRIPHGPPRLQAVTEAREQASAVFRGRVVREVNTLTLALRDPAAPMDYAASGYYILQVNRTWKGPLVDEVRLWVGEPHAPCGLLLTLGQEYLIYGNLTPMADMEAAGCSRVLSGLEAYYDTWYLGRGVVRPSVQ